MKKIFMKSYTRYIFLLLALALLYLSGTKNSLLLESRIAMRIAPSGNEERGSSVTTVILGGFSGLLADILWLRCSYLKDAGEYFELVPLANFITSLQPHSVDAWAFHAWNMAYNVSVMMPRPEDKWRWVKNGIELLRDRGIQFNYSDVRLYWELGSIYQFKIGDTFDPICKYYRIALAKEISEILDKMPVSYEYIDKSDKIKSLLQEKYKLIPELMKKVDEKYGPLDWRLPWSHAVYWAYRGKQRAKHKRSLQCDRMIFQSLATIFRHGQFLEPYSGDGAISPDTNLLYRAISAYEESLLTYPGDETVITSYSNFLYDAVNRLYTAGHVRQAEDAEKVMLRHFPVTKLDKTISFSITNGIVR